MIGRFENLARRIWRKLKAMKPAQPPPPWGPESYGSRGELARLPHTESARMYGDRQFAAMEMTADELVAFMKQSPQPQLVDCRELVEMIHGGIIPGALAIPMSEFDARTDEIDRSRLVICYCAHGVRSLSVAAYLHSLGFQVRSLRGGICEWRGERLPFKPDQNL